jgi:glycosyltransferase involved in cell wall biosynthesis
MGSPPATDRPQLSILVPVFNEADSLPRLYREVASVCEDLGRRWELLFVDDGSTDGSQGVLDQLLEQDERITVIHFRRNFGKSPALAAGFEHVRGDLVITMDADLQDDPSMIPDFVERIEAGADLVSGWKKKRHDPLGKTLPSRIFNAIVRFVGGIHLHDVNCGFKAYRIECVRSLHMYGGFHRFVPVFAHDRGFRVEELVVRHRPREHGQSKFGALRFIDGLLSLPTVLLLTRYRLRPMQFFGLPGALLALLGFFILLYLTVIWFMGESIGTRPLLLLGVLLVVTGVQIAGLGLVGEMLVHMTPGNREIYSIRDIRGPAAQTAHRHRDPVAASTDTDARTPMHSSGP